MTRHVDALAAVYAARRVPCICPRQHERQPPVGESQGITKGRGVIVEQVKCSDCGKRWKRVNA